MNSTKASADTAPTPASDGFIPSDSDNISLFDDPVTDNVLHVLIALGAEFWTLRRRMFVLEKVLKKAGVSSADHGVLSVMLPFSVTSPLRPS